MLLFIDNYDSFTWNIVDYFANLGNEPKVVRNDEIDLEGIEKLAPEKIVVGPGPCTPKEAGISVPAIKHFAGKIPILGVCLGHQAIGMAFGGNVVKAKRPMHGRVSMVTHNGKGIFEGITNPVKAIRYHSLVIEKASIPDCLEITATSDDDGEIMGVRHKEYEIHGIQYHPEGLLSEEGHDILSNFLKIKS